ncbi:MAG: ABC transporter ATP-binding protein/permease [Bacillales bacterium]|jgi:ATP-binding cassette subfamily B protein|nr:ABC transporter ATP-binding protein/permease [Bacillales bacterium]
MPRGMNKRVNVPSKEKINFKSLKKVIVFLKPFIVFFVIAIILGIGGAVLTLLGPDQMKNLVNVIEKGLTGPMNFELVTKYGIILICFYAGGALISYISSFILGTITQLFSKSLRTVIDKKFNKLPLKYFDSASKGDLLSVVSNDVDTLSQTLGNSLSNLISSTILLIGSIIMMFTSHYLLAIVTIVSSLLGMVMMLFIMLKSQKHFVANQRELGKLNGLIEETYSNHNIVKAFNAEDKIKKEYKKNNKALFSSNQKSQFLSGLMMPIMTFFGHFGYVLIFVISALLLSSGSTIIDLGVIAAFLLYQRLFTQPLGTIAQSMASFQQASAASVRIVSLLDEKEIESEENIISKTIEVKGEVEFRNVAFGYDENREIIHNFSITTKPGQKVAIVGPTGAGKTTIVNLLMKFYEVNSGEIIIDGVPIKEIKRYDLHNLFDMILQDTWLFNGTIRDNIIYSQKLISDAEILKICEAVGLLHFINCLPKGLDTLLNDSASLSEGQKQQITIARAMVDMSPMLILDEATSSLDSMTEIIIQNAMDSLTVGRTNFVIAHRLSTIKNADLILVMKDGDIVESGNHQELLNRNGFYAELYNSQFENHL